MKNRQILMIGDSITEGFDLEKLLSEYNMLNLGISGDSTVEVLGRIDPKWFNENPDTAFLCIGTNDIARDRDDVTILKNIELIIKNIKLQCPEIRIVIFPIFPTRDNPPRPNKRIMGLNKAIDNLAKQEGVSFLDIYGSFTDPEGKLKEVFTEDGLHLTKQAYITWADLIRKYIEGFQEINSRNV